MTNMKEEVLKKIALTPKGREREKLLADDNIRNCVLSSGANVTLYCGELKEKPENAVDEISEIYVGLILRRNKKGNFDGLGALGGLAERTDKQKFTRLAEDEKLELVGKKDDVVLVGGKAILIDDIDVICKNNVLRELKEELFDLGIKDIKIDKEKLELIKLCNVKDDNYITNIWEGSGECYAISPYCHVYKDDEGIIDKICDKGCAKEGGEVNGYKKIPLFEALKCFGNYSNAEFTLEDGRDAKNDYRYAHEYLALWGFTSRILGDDEKLMELALCVQEDTKHRISFREVAKHTKQSIEDVALSLNVDMQTLLCIENGLHKVYKKNNKQPIANIIKNYFYRDK